MITGNKKIKSGIFLLFLVFNSCFASSKKLEKQSFRDFAESFIRHYDVRPEGRYAHEYHPFLLKETAKSLAELESAMTERGFDVAGRMVIVGYEENAVPQYYTDCTRARINDEASIKNDVGWSMRLHNKFGFMTGFVFRSVNDLSHYYFPDQPQVFEHVLGHDIHLFNSRASIFQEHAFGQAFDITLATERKVVDSFKLGNFKHIFTHLMDYWRVLYEEALKVGNRQLAGTQDILFSIAYADHLLHSSLPIFHYFTGPDITYPIEISCKYQQDVTEHSQSFIKRLASQLNSQDNQETAYIFCSFVDGVGKSTTLGNIKNWMKHGDNISQFQHVDNSSSQLAEIFKFKEKVHIVDLPAQISHFTYKPDGLVYVDARTELSLEQIDRVTSHFHEHRDEYYSAYHELIDRAQGVIDEKGFLAECFHDGSDPELAFVKNIMLLKKIKKSKWIPFKYENELYIYNDTHPAELRVLVSLSDVKSEGLKNIESEQMLFFGGLKFPLAFNIFKDDLTEKLALANVKKVVFVDFMSMYPRSSRENIRINYLLQQLAHLDHGFNPHDSLYRDFVTGGELLHSLMNTKMRARMKAAFEQEVLLRHALYETVIDRADSGVQGYFLDEITRLVKNRLEKNTSEDLLWLHHKINDKMTKEAEKLYEVYGLTKDFVNFQQFSFVRAKAFSDILAELFSHAIENESLNNLWDGLAHLACPLTHIQDGACHSFCDLGEGKNVRVCFKHHVECRDEFSLSSLLRMIRAAWYACCINILYSEKMYKGVHSLKAEYFCVPPLYFSYDRKDYYYLLQKVLEPWDQEVSLMSQFPLQFLNIPFSKKALCGKHNNKPYNLDWNSSATHTGLFAYDCSLTRKKLNNDYSSSEGLSLVSLMVQRYQTKHGISSVMPTSHLEKKLKKSLVWRINYRNTIKEARENGYAYGMKKEATHKKLPKGKSSDTSDKKKIFLGHKNQRSGAKLLARLLATLEMIVKDPDSDVVVRFGNRQDFAAALRLFETVTLPRYFSLCFDEPLFKDYEHVEPYPSWEFWDKYQEAV